MLVVESIGLIESLERRSCLGGFVDGFSANENKSDARASWLVEWYGVGYTKECEWQGRGSPMEERIELD